ncbi:hypothetical protein ACLOJK_024853 [Asimina triloba]
MERPNGNQKKTPKKPKSMKKPLKIVYISNPVKFFTSASKFRDLVQGLTGRDSDPADMKKFLVAYNADDFSQGREDEPEAEAEVEAEAAAEGGIDDSSAGSRPPPDGDPNHGALPISLTSHQLDIFDDVFTPQMLEDFAGGLDVFKNLGSF